MACDKPGGEFVTSWRPTALLLPVAMAFGAGPVASAQETRPPSCFPTCPPVVEAGDGVIDVIATSGTSDQVPGRGDGTEGESPGRTTWFTIEEYLTPSCASNALNGADLLCTSAVNSCEPDQVRYWVWHRATTHQLGPPRTSVAGPWLQEPGSYCLGPDDPGVPDIGRVVAEVQTAFQRLPLPVFATTVSPWPQTLVNLDTRLRAGASAPAFFAPVLLGIPVRITATPVSWAWTFGDGTATTTARPDTEHVYLAPQLLNASVRVTWIGTFTIGDSAEVFTIRAPAYVQGPATAIDVKVARTELVAG